MKRTLIAFLALVALLVPTAALATPTKACYETVTNPDYVAEYTIEHEAVYETVVVTPAVPAQAEEGYIEHQYGKQVRGVVQQRDNGQYTWHNTGRSFDWTWWAPASTQWSREDVAVLSSGPHSGVVREWTEGNGHKHWREKATEYRYVKTGETRYTKTKDAVPAQPAVTEDRLVTEARTEIVPAVGTPTIEIEVPCAPTPTPTEEPTSTPSPSPEPTPTTTPSSEPTPTPSEPKPTASQPSTPTPSTSPSPAPTTQTPVPPPSSGTAQTSVSVADTPETPVTLAATGPTDPRLWAIATCAIALGVGMLIVRRRRETN